MIFHKQDVSVYPHIAETTALRRIEEIGRICYKSEDKIGDGTAERFVRSIIRRGHESVLEHATFCITMCEETLYDVRALLGVLELNYGFRSFLRATNITRPLLSGNTRAWRDFFHACDVCKLRIPDVMQVLVKSEPVLFLEWQDYEFFGDLFSEGVLVDTRSLVNRIEKMVHHDISVKFLCDRGVSHEFVRHRVASVSQESTRYCNYAGELGVVDIYTAFDINPAENANERERYQVWRRAQQQAEENYTELVHLGAKPDEARSVLNNSTKTEVVMTMNGFGWDNFLTLRNARAAHPQARECAALLHAWVEKNANYILTSWEA